MKEIAEIIKAVAWPIAIVTVVLMFKAQVISLLASFSTKVADANRLKLRVAGATMELACEVVRGSIPLSGKSTGPTGETEA
jgi:hypothetical protein